MSEISRLKWLCRRGVKELDIVFTEYLNNEYAAAPESEKQAFAELLEIEDPDLFLLVLGSKQTDNAAQAALVKKLRTVISERKST